jgi:hypothetical protein
MRTRRSSEQWSALFDELSASGESVETFCRRRGIRRATLYWWKWKLGASRRKSARAEDVRLLAVSVSSGSGVGAAAARVIVIQVSGLQVQVETGTDVAYVGALVDAIRSRC